MGLKETFKKQGGLSLIRNYMRAGCLGTSVAQFVLLGKDRTALEILRLSAQYKTKRKIERQYKKFLDEFMNIYEKDYLDLAHNTSDYVWVCWFQGLDEAPEIVKKCYAQLCSQLKNKKVVLITEDNLLDYVEFPHYIIDKWKKGIITHTHLTDLLRLELLIKHGGMWIDATVWCSQTDEQIPEYFFNSELFFYQMLKPGRDGNSMYISSWLMSAKTNNIVLLATRYLCYKYWEKKNYLVDYFLLHIFMSIVLENYENEWKNVVPRDNATPHNLLLRLFDEFDEATYDAILSQSPFHKLSYKFTEEQLKLEGTYFKKMFS